MPLISGYYCLFSNTSDDQLDAPDRQPQGDATVPLHDRKVVDEECGR